MHTRMGSFPREYSKKVDVKSPIQGNAEPPKQNDLISKQNDSRKESKETLPLPQRSGQHPAHSGDYFSGAHGHLATETNPFDFSFASGSNNNTNGSGVIQTPGGTRLPPVSDLTSSAGILGSGNTSTYWGNNSLRSGPVSPSMIGTPQKSREDYFSDGHHIRDLRAGFITANESALRSGFTPGADAHVRAGLTPGGSGSMFPDPIPNPPNIFNPITSGVSTPPSLEFHRIAMNVPKITQVQQTTNVTSQPQEQIKGTEAKPTGPGQYDDANAAASGLFLLAQSRDGSQQVGQYAVQSTQLPIHGHPPAPKTDTGDQPRETSPIPSHQKHSSISTGDSASDNENNRSKVRDRGKKALPVTNGRRKASEPSPKIHPGKKSKSNNGTAQSTEEPPSEEESAEKNNEVGTDGKKMTDEEKRKNFLERNRIAALKCRQRKKQWLNSLQAKVEVYASENEGLNAQIQALRDEIVHIKTLLLAHKECPVSVAQGISGMNMHQLMNEGGFTGPMNPYGIAAPLNQQQQVISGQALQQRRYS